MQDLPRGLLWTTYGCGEVISGYDGPSWSWASLKPQLTMDIYTPIFKGSASESISVIDCKVKTLGQGAYGEVGPGQLILGQLILEGSISSATKFLKEGRLHCNYLAKGPITSYHKLETYRSDHPVHFVKPENLGQFICNFDIVKKSNDTESTQLDGASSATFELSLPVMFHRVHFLQILTVIEVDRVSEDYVDYHLILALMLAETDQKDVFRKVGIAEIPGTPENLGSEWETRRITII